MNSSTFFAVRVLRAIAPRWGPNWCVVGMLVGVVLGAFALATAQAPQSPGVIRATRFVLVDDDGKERAVLGFKGQSVGLYIYGQGDEKNPEPFISLDSTPVSDKVANTRLEVRNGLTETEAFVSPNSIGIRDTKRREQVALNYIGAPSLEFADRSGFPYVRLWHDETAGVEFDIRSPLGIDDAFGRELTSFVQGEKGDARIYEALQRSLRFQCSVPPFANPSMTLRKDGRVIWTAKGD